MKDLAKIVASMLLSLFFIGIIIFVLIGVFDFESSEIFANSLVMVLINFLIVIGVIGFGKPLSKLIGAGMYVPVCVVTVIYLIASFVFTFVMLGTDHEIAYTLVNLVMLFIYLCIVIPMSVAGINSNSDK